MPIKFKMPMKILGFSLNTALPGESVNISSLELLGPRDAIRLHQRLEQLQVSVFREIPGLPPPSLTDHLVVIIKKDLTCVAYVNELGAKALVEVINPIEAGSPVFASQIKDIISVDLNIEVPKDAGVIAFRSLGWKRSLFFDFTPLHQGNGDRQFKLEHVFARQALMLLDLFPPGHDRMLDEEISQTRVVSMENGLARMESLLESRCESEESYQELLKNHPWMFGGTYVRIDRQTVLDDKRIPDFTGVRCTDEFRDIIEIKQPFLVWFRKDGTFAQAFNDAWNQAESYLTFARRCRQYLADEKGLNFENPSCLLIGGYKIPADSRRRIREKEQISTSIRVITYDQVFRQAQHLVSLMKSAGKMVAVDKSS